MNAAPGAATVADYVAAVDPAWRPALERILVVVRKNLPAGFAEELSYGMPGFVVPLSLYPKGYRCDPKLPLPFLSVAVQKRHLSFYHLGLYAKPELLAWFVAEYDKLTLSRKLDMGKSCLRWKRPTDIPYELLGRLAAAMTSAEWIALAEAADRGTGTGRRS
ncbi:MAG: DUF1801 domain-containing protein [Spirochaetaceae bacterium]|nr:DUF1801 domain-containing protein [Spirochaetaceae bacterium]